LELSDSLLWYASGEMGYRDKRNEWLREVEQRRRDIVFPQFSKDEISLWRTLKQRPLNLPAKIAFIWFVVSMVGFAVFVLVQSHREGELRDLAVTTGLTIVLFIAPIFCSHRVVGSSQSARDSRPESKSQDSTASILGFCRYFSEAL